MTDDQMQSITDMNITQQDVLASIQGATVVSGSSSHSTVSLPSDSASGGGMPAGGPPADGGAPPDGAMPADMGGAASTSGTSQTQSSQAGTSSTVITGVPSALVEAVIQSLQQKIAA